MKIEVTLAGEGWKARFEYVPGCVTDDQGIKKGISAYSVVEYKIRMYSGLGWGIAQSK